MKTSRRRARELTLQVLYAWQLGGGDAGETVEHAKTLDGWDRADRALGELLIRGVIGKASELEQHISRGLESRRFAELAPVERAILYAATFELAFCPETPLKVVINEAIELGRAFGGTDGHRFVNGVLEKIATSLRPDERERVRQPA